MKKVVTKFCFLLVLATTFCGCDGVEELVNMLNCEFEVQNVEDFTFAGVHFDQLDSINDISDQDMAIIEAAIEAKDAPLNFTIHILGTNPNDVEASVEKLQWILAIDSLNVAEGVVTDGFTIPAKSTNILTLVVNTNVTDIFEEDVLENVFNIYQEIVNGRTSTVTIKIKPTINDTDFPHYIKLEYMMNKED